MEKKSIIAITGPSGVGKTTLGTKLEEDFHIIIPRHCTTRTRRMDDKEGFYRYLTHYEYKNLFLENKFLISSGDGKIITKENGNFYGVLKNDCEEAWNFSNQIILYTSYKDIYQLNELKNKYDINIINLTFNNIEYGVEYRLKKDKFRMHTKDDIKNRINSALSDQELYGKLVNDSAKSIICTDQLGIEETYEKVCKDLKLIKKGNFYE